MEIPRKVKIVELTARDGLEGYRKFIPVDFRVELVEKLSAAGFPAVEVGEFVSPKVIPAMQGSDEVARKITRTDGVEYSALVPNLRGFNDAVASGVRIITIFGAATEKFSQANINCTIAESFARFDAVVEEAVSKQVRVRGAVSCVAGCPYEGPVSPVAVAKLVKKYYDMGCYEIALGDSIGVGTPKTIKVLIEACLQQGVPLGALSAHFHNTCGMALANCYAALEMGVSTFESACGGLGGCPNAPGATGNLSSEELVYMLDGLGVETGVDLSKAVDVGAWVTDKLGHRLDSKVTEAMTNQDMTYFDHVGPERRFAT